jgi:hypothetical protein
LLKAKGFNALNRIRVALLCVQLGIRTQNKQEKTGQTQFRFHAASLNIFYPLTRNR